jgi:hypothetical protein
MMELKTVIIDGQETDVIDVKIGDYISIKFTFSDDIDLLDWLDEQFENKFKVTDVEYDTWGLWIEGCPYRIALDEIVVWDRK